MRDDKTPRKSQTDRPYSLDDSVPYLTRVISARNFVNLRRALRPLRVGPVEWRVLTALHRDGESNIADLAVRTATDRSNLAAVVGEMHEAGLVSRRPSPRDRRNVLLKLTAAGQRKYESVKPTVLQVVDGATAGFTEAELETLIDLLKRVRDNVESEDGVSDLVS